MENYKALGNRLLRVESKLNGMNRSLKVKDSNTQLAIGFVRHTGQIERGKIVARLDEGVSTLSEEFDTVHTDYSIELNNIGSRIDTWIRKTMTTLSELQEQINELKSYLGETKEQTRIQKRKMELLKEIKTIEKRVETTFKTQLLGFSVFLGFYGIMHLQQFNCSNRWFSLTLLISSILGVVPFYWMMASKIYHLSKRVESIVKRNTMLKDDQDVGTLDMTWRYLFPTIGLGTFIVLYALLLVIMVFYSCEK